MLNKDNERELAYLVTVNDITPMNADRLELAHIAGWQVVVGKGEFKPGDLAIYFEIDSQLPEVEPFTSMEFLKSKHYKIKTQKIRGELSQGFLVSPTSLGFNVWFDGTEKYLCETEYPDVDPCYYVTDETRFLTKKIGVTYAVADDNQRKAKTPDKYKAMSTRCGKIARSWWWRALYKTEAGKKILFFFFGKKRDKKSSWPNWVKKTDEERCQNMPWLFSDPDWHDQTWVATEKVDGTSTTFTMRGFGRKRQFFVCSRNVVFDKPDKKCFYEENFYTKMAEKYNMEEVCDKLLTEWHNGDKEVEFVTIQGETFGAHVQKREYGIKEQELRVFNVIIGYKDGHTNRLNPMMGKAWMDRYGVPYVPIIDTEFKLPDTCNDLLEIATGNSVIDGGMREGIVFRSMDGERSFKAVSNSYLLSYHC